MERDDICEKKQNLRKKSNVGNKPFIHHLFIIQGMHVHPIVQHSIASWVFLSSVTEIYFYLSSFDKKIQSSSLAQLEQTTKLHKTRQFYTTFCAFATNLLRE